jgi:hypothetical protein
LSRTNNLAALARRSVGTAAGNIPVLDSNAQIPVHTVPQILYVQQAHATNTAGGAASNSGWQKRPLNTEKSNTITGATFNSGTGVISLPAGKYKSSCSQSFSEVGMVSSRLRDTTNNVSLVVGVRGHVPSSQNGSTTLEGPFTLTGTANIELQYNCKNNKTVSGLGPPQNDGDVEVYASLIIEKIG